MGVGGRGGALVMMVVMVMKVVMMVAIGGLHEKPAALSARTPAAVRAR